MGDSGRSWEQLDTFAYSKRLLKEKGGCSEEQTPEGGDRTPLWSWFFGVERFNNRHFSFHPYFYMWDLNTLPVLSGFYVLSTSVRSRTVTVFIITWSPVLLWRRRVVSDLLLRFGPTGAPRLLVTAIMTIVILLNVSNKVVYNNNY